MFRFFYYIFFRYLLPFKFFRYAPHNRWIDNFFALFRFVRAHNRLPSDAMRFNDVLYRLKISDEIEDDLRVKTTDKEFVKDYIRSVVGDEYNIKTLAILRSASDLHNYTFPPRCAIKLTNSSGDYIIKQEDDSVDLSELSDWFSLDYYRRKRERHYRGLVSKIIVEELVFDNAVANDIKFHCVGGKVKIIQFDYDRLTSHRQILYDRNMNSLRVAMESPLYEGDSIPPSCLSDMIAIAEKLSEPFSTVRIDMYSDGTKFYVGEITHLHLGSTGYFCTDGVESPESAEARINKVLFG